MDLTITRPDDWHLHVRDGTALGTFLAHTARAFARAIIMPNLRPPVANTAQALAYRQRILAAAPAHSGFEPLMTLYLTDRTTPEEIATAKASGHIYGAKLYPAGATTNSDNGVTDIPALHPVLEAMAEVGLTLQVHAEVTDQTVDIFDREQAFLERILRPIVDRHPKLKVVVEHITTRDAVDFVLSTPPTVAATITAHHLLYSRNALFSGGLRPHFYCLPILKREGHRAALLEAIAAGSSKFFLGTDSAPHPRRAKESDCGCAGIYTAHAALELYAEAFDMAGALDRLEAFASFNGADFYGLPRNQETITLQHRPWRIPESYPLGGDTLQPLRAGEHVSWRLAEAP